MYEVEEVFECSHVRCRLEHQKLRFIISNGSCYFIMKPRWINKSSILLWCFNEVDHISKKRRCKASLLLEFGDEIQTEWDPEAPKTVHKLRRFASGTKKELLLLKSSYTVAPHRVT